MIELPAPEKLVGDTLQQELRDAGFSTAQVTFSEGTLLIYNVKKEDTEQVRAVVNAHKGNLLPEAQASFDSRKVLEGLKAKAKEVAAGRASFTPAERDRILAALIEGA